MNPSRASLSSEASAFAATMGGRFSGEDRVGGLEAMLELHLDPDDPAHPRA
jgi:hypothetical protein